jgi:hypothetical protein
MMAKQKTELTQAHTRLEAARAEHQRLTDELAANQAADVENERQLAVLHNMPSGNRIAYGGWQQAVSERTTRRHELHASAKELRAALTAAAGELHAAEHAAQRESEAIHATE